MIETFLILAIIYTTVQLIFLYDNRKSIKDAEKHINEHNKRHEKINNELGCLFKKIGEIEQIKKSELENIYEIYSQIDKIDVKMKSEEKND